MRIEELRKMIESGSADQCIRASITHFEALVTVAQAAQSVLEHLNPILFATATAVLRKELSKLESINSKITDYNPSNEKLSGVEL